MPTANRRAFVGHAIEQFLPQDYPRRELIVVDDGEDCIADLIPEHDLVRYLRLDLRSDEFVGMVIFLVDRRLE
jgi:glycosyltransferase involved in cell wall biosynthesis